MGELLTEIFSDLIPIYIFIFVSIYLHILIHEGGHLIFGLLTKYKFLSFRVFNIVLIKTDGKIKLKKFSLAGTGGQCIMIPPDFENGKIPYLLYNAGGAMLNFITSLICIILNIYLIDSTYFSEFTFFFVLFGILFGLLNIIPFKNKLIANDGKNILEISKSVNAMEAFWRMLKINSLLNEGVRVRDMSEYYFPKPSDLDLKNNITAGSGYLFVVRLMEKKEYSEAKNYIEYLLSQDTALLGIYKSILTCELIYCNLLSGDFDAIDKLLDKNILTFFKQAKTMLPVLRVQYLLALIKTKDDVLAEKFFRKFEKAASGYPVPVEAQSEYELIEVLKSVYKNQL